MAAKWAIPSVLILILATACTKGDSEPDPEEYLSGVVHIGVNSGIPGWSDYNNGVWGGFDISLAHWLAEEIGFKPEFTPLTTDERMTKLREEDGSIKLVLANFSMTDDRRRFIDFAGPYFDDAQGVLTLRGSNIQQLEHIEHKPVCVTHGSTSDIRIGSTLVVGVQERTHRRCVQLLLDGKVTAISSDIALLEGFVAKDTRLQMASGIRVGSERYGIGLRNDKPKLCAFLTRKLTKFLNEAWEQKLKDTLPWLSAENRKPNSDAMAPCEQPSDANAQAYTAPPPARTTAVRARTRRRVSR